MRDAGMGIWCSDEEAGIILMVQSSSKSLNDLGGRLRVKLLSTLLPIGLTNGEQEEGSGAGIMASMVDEESRKKSGSIRSCSLEHRMFVRLLKKGDSKFRP
ncbi:hypothetical protein SUGI_0403440 [Cryptomeria japonica]|nr:hypothetical protein SUGI_0403440 [Cryptomeria japonica]